ncbi:MAG: BlaI/MecI/CopY family transcriptional regulator [Bacillota bacterium]|jgi:predicted transcriptional regulator|nr:BlaI/MecI/CopY family transcriptional regulator [Bacillota bacterium]MDD3297873.1 BlaI/MecI/CopY family transcriptional regulator [Bacillota bacterium]MDD3850915.1 BlaI/MecI/CopY family transcriptional regulator [Bacillota bacterium]MDD4707675.1 BlaI/MecI/CopY family transcriptional regulator [Bacillota bacterium]
MKGYKLTDTEAKFADIIWANGPIPSGDLVKLCEVELDWKKSTTYTMLKRLENKGFFKNRNSVVSALVKKDEFYAGQSKQFVEETFDGSLPRFLAAFTRSKRLSDREIDELQRLIDEHRGDSNG